MTFLEICGCRYIFLRVCSDCDHVFRFTEQPVKKRAAIGTTCSGVLFHRTEAVDCNVFFLAKTQNTTPATPKKLVRGISYFILQIYFLICFARYFTLLHFSSSLLEMLPTTSIMSDGTVYLWTRRISRVSITTNCAM